MLHPSPQGDRQAIKAQASADQAWYERQQASRAKLLQEQKLAAEREQRRARTAASECEHRNHVLEAELALADRKRELELQNTKEEQEAGRLMDQVGGGGLLLERVCMYVCAGEGGGLVDVDGVPQGATATLATCIRHWWNDEQAGTQDCVML